ncbi:MAG: hypothetical protein DHS20C17_03540 [Cyclobacteriaceae bacterium]|nr:MAG: hypothetical protein DHS20C17_03540 [Cyclobacteriaceae bacterium]
MGASITTIDPSDKSDLKRFISLERKLMKNYPLYISEIDDDVVKFLTRKNLMAKEMEFGLFVVSKSEQDVGRCAAIINRKFQQQKNRLVLVLSDFLQQQRVAIRK